MRSTQQTQPPTQGKDLERKGKFNDGFIHKVTNARKRKANFLTAWLGLLGGRRSDPLETIRNNLVPYRWSRLVVHSTMAGILVAMFGLGAAGVGAAVGVCGIVVFTTTNNLFLPGHGSWIRPFAAGPSFRPVRRYCDSDQRD